MTDRTLRLTRPWPIAFVAALAAWWPLSVQAMPRHFSLASYQVNPGARIQVPLSLDNAAGLAAIEVKINFDPDVLTLETVSGGPLGDAFELSYGHGEGFVKIVFARAEALAGGSGRLAMLRFRANPGAGIELNSELTIADLVLSDETGVIDLRQKDELGTANGRVDLSADDNIDNSGNGLPDWWEEAHGLDAYATAVGRDDDNDTLDNLLEYAFGGDPNVPDAAAVAPFGTVEESDGQAYMALTFRRRIPPAPLRYLLEEGSVLSEWNAVDPDLRLLSPPVDLGNGLERVTVRGDDPIGEPDSPPRGFLRIKVETGGSP